MSEENTGKRLYDWLEKQLQESQSACHDIGLVCPEKINTISGMEEWGKRERELTDKCSVLAIYIDWLGDILSGRIKIEDK